MKSGAFFVVGQSKLTDKLTDWRYSMSILDRLTDDQLKEMLALKEIEAAGLRVQIKKLKERLVKWKDLAETRMVRICDLSSELAEIRRERGT